MAISRADALRKALETRILLLDGAMGTLLQRVPLSEADFRGARFVDHGVDLKGNGDLLNLVRPDLVRGGHRAYLEAGADIIETNTFTSTPVTQAEYGLEHLCEELNEQGARLARAEADAFSTPERPRFVAGCLGPTGRSAGMSRDVDDPAARNVTYDELADGYLRCARALVRGGADLLLVETVFDTLNAKAAIYALTTWMEEEGLDIPIWVSGTLTDRAGRTLNGQTPEAFWLAMRHARPLMFGFNCALGVDDLAPHVAELSPLIDTALTLHANAGLPNAMGGYDDTPDHMAKVIRDLGERGLLNVVGGCCGTTPQHIRAIGEAIEGLTPRRIPARRVAFELAGLEPMVHRRGDLFANIGERTNVTGSAAFRRLVQDGRWEDAVGVARQQVQAGAQMLDVNVDEGLLDGPSTMARFLRHLAAEPEIARIPVVIDSSRHEVLIAGLKEVAGRPLVNSLSLKEGEEAFLEAARQVRRVGAAVIVMAFDEAGQADTVERKVAIAERAVGLLLSVGFAPQEIVIDANIFAIGTGMREHDGYGMAFIDAVAKLAERWPEVRTSGGVSNVSFAFRGNGAVREAIHAVFLQHAIRAGLSMGIVNAGALPLVDDLEADLRERVEDLVLNRRADATERLLAVAGSLKGKRDGPDPAAEAWRSGTVEERLVHALVHGIADDIEADVELARLAAGHPMEVIEGPGRPKCLTNEEELWAEAHVA